jgi:SAM-dependent methyltransferase
MTTLVAIGALVGAMGCDDDNLNQIPQPGSVSGQVCDPGEGRGLAGARVYVLVGSRQEVIETETASDGTFTLEGVPVGEHTVYISRGSFSTEVNGVLVEEELDTPLSEEECLAPDDVTMIVFDGHDNVQEVLGRLGYAGFDVVDTHHEWDERDETTTSWIIDAFGDYEAFASYDIVFINCAAHEWAIDVAYPTVDIERALGNLRRFVAEGGSLYLSDWSYDLLEELYPDAVDWANDDNEWNAAEVGIEQEFLATVESDDLISFLNGQNEVLLRYELSRIAMPRTLGPGSRALLLADVLVEGETEEEPLTYNRVPVLLEHQPEVFGTDPDEVGRVIFTTFHNGANNSRDMDEMLRAIVFSL